MSAHYDISEKLEVLKTLVKYIWIGEKQAAKLEWFVLTIPPPETLSKPTSSWEMFRFWQKHVFQRDKKNCPYPKHLFSYCIKQSWNRLPSRALSCYCHLHSFACHEPREASNDLKVLVQHIAAICPLFSFHAPAHQSLCSPADINTCISWKLVTHSSLSANKHAHITFQRKTNCSPTL